MGNLPFFELWGHNSVLVKIVKIDGQDFFIIFLKLIDISSELVYNISDEVMI